MSGESVWGSGEMVFSAPAAVAAEFSKNGIEFAVAFPDNQLRLEPDVGPTSLTQVVSFRVPLTVPANQQLTGYLQTMTIGVSRSPDVRVLVVADLAGTVKTIEFDYEASGGTPVEEPLTVVRFVSLQGVEQAGAGAVGLIGPVAEYAATMSITIQRRTLVGQGFVQIDGLDVDAILSTPPQG